MTDNKKLMIDLLQTEFSADFVQKMKNRMLTSYFKYGKVKENYPSKYDTIASAKKRLALYEETGNTEWLIDASNFCMIESMYPNHTNAHFQATSSDESPGLTKKE